jgi:hypothetical protein
MRQIIPFPGHNTAFEVDTDYLEGNGCGCILCRPQGSLLSFMSRDHLELNGGRPAHRFNRQRLNHQFTAVREAEAAWVPAPKVDRLQFRRARTA